MRLVLHYRGLLKSNGSPSHKHEIREAFHAQLATLWSQAPLISEPQLLQPESESDGSLLRSMGSFVFVPLVSARLLTVAELRITLLRPEAPGGLITRGGDIDNRLKTLFDSLTMPRHSNALPSNAVPKQGQSPFFCLLEDDNLVTSVSVSTEQLLEQGVDQATVDLTILANTATTDFTIANHIFSR